MFLQSHWWMFALCCNSLENYKLFWDCWLLLFFSWFSKASLHSLCIAIWTQLHFSSKVVGTFFNSFYWAKHQPLIMLGVFLEGSKGFLCQEILDSWSSPKKARRWFKCNTWNLSILIPQSHYNEPTKINLKTCTLEFKHDKGLKWFYLILKGSEELKVAIWNAICDYNISLCKFFSIPLTITS